MQARCLCWSVEHISSTRQRADIHTPAVPKGTKPEAAVLYGGFSFLWPCLFLWHLCHTEFRTWTFRLLCSQNKVGGGEALHDMASWVWCPSLWWLWRTPTTQPVQLGPNTSAPPPTCATVYIHHWGSLCHLLYPPWSVFPIKFYSEDVLLWHVLLFIWSLRTWTIVF